MNSYGMQSLVDFVDTFLDSEVDIKTVSILKHSMIVTY